MLLISPTDAALAIGARCGGSAPSVDEPQLLSILNFITPRVEDALNVYSLTFCNNVDRFPTPSYPSTSSPVITLRLSNGFVTPETVEIIDADGNVVDIAAYADIDYELGVINLSSWVPGYCTVNYQSGFEPEIEPANPSPDYDEAQRVLVGVPEWIRAITVALLVVWYRTVFLAPRVNKDIRYNFLMESLIRELRTRVYGRFLRPRADTIFAERRGYGN